MDVNKADDTLNVIFTIDVENEFGNDPGKIEGDLSEFGIKENCGINYIMDTFSSYDAKAVFFVNVYEHKRYDPEYMPSLLRRIDQRGHEVALHAHGKNLDTCSREEQRDFFRQGRDYIYQAIGKYPISYRAGAYRANDFTFGALHDIGIRIDSSVFYTSKNNNFKWHANKKNGIFRVGRIIEIPVTVLWNGKDWKKLDINWLTEDELIRTFELMRKSSMYHTVQCMFHSFSFMKGRPPCAELPEEKKKFESVLRFLRSSEKYRILTFEQYLKENPDPDDLEADVIYLADRELSLSPLDIKIKYDKNVLTLTNHFDGGEVTQYYWSIYPEKDNPGSKYLFQSSNNTCRIELTVRADGKQIIYSGIKLKDGRRIGFGYYFAEVSHGQILQIARRY